MTQRSVLTLGLGRPHYFRMACALARSFQRWHPDSRIGFTVVTDIDEKLPRDLRACELVRIRPGEFGPAFKPKLYLDLLARSEQTLFIDADCLIYEPLDRIFDRLAGRAVATVGWQVSKGEWFGNIAKFCGNLRVPSIPKFNGGLYYLEKGAKSDAVYAEARRLLPQYDALGLTRLRDHPNDELLMAAAMARDGLEALPDDGTFLSDPQACPGAMQLNVLSGRRVLRNPPSPSPLHRDWYPFEAVSPAIVHFLGHWALGHAYRTEVRRLSLAAAGAPRVLADLLATATVRWPGEADQRFRDTFRPMFRRVFGTRRIRSTFRTP
jgi:hypothetical protein